MKSKQGKAIRQQGKSASKAKKSGKGKVKKERGALLSILLVLILLGSAFTTFVTFGVIKEEYRDSTSWILVVLALTSLADIIAVVGMWYWKKWGIYLAAANRVVSAAIHLMLTGFLLVVFYDLLPLVVLAYIINLQSKTELFE